METRAHPTSTVLVKTVNRYDVFGRLVQSVSGNGFDTNGNALSNIADFTTQNTYDALDHLLNVQHGIGVGNVKIARQTSVTTTMGNLVQSYTYDADGNRIASWDGTRSSADDTTPVVTKYAYDAAGHLLKTTLPATTGAGSLAAADITYSYDDHGHLSGQTDAKGAHASWAYDYFGQKILAHMDFGGDVYSYTYDLAGQLTAQTSKTAANAALQNLTYAYDAAGNQTQILDASVNEVTAYGYDLANRRVLEKVSIGAVVYQDNHLAYDAAGRLMDSADSEVHVSFQYDNAGNRTFVGTHVLLDGALRVGTKELDNTSDGYSTQYFTYDGMNRQLHVAWTSASNIGTQGHTLTYDADGNRTTDTFLGNTVTVSYDGNSTPTSFAAVANALVTETYAYDADDRLTQATYGVNNNAQQIVIDSRAYDSASRLLASGGGGPFGMLAALNKVDVSHGLVGDKLDLDSRGYLYDERGELTTVSTYATLQPGMSNSLNTMNYVYDQAGNKTRTVLTTNVLDASSVMHTFTNTTDIAYGLRESYLEKAESSTEVTTTMTQGMPGSKKTSTSSYSTATAYDGNGYATLVTNVDLGSSALVSDAQGRVLRSTLNLIGSYQKRNLIIAGQEIGQYGVDNDAAKGYTQVDDFLVSYKSLEDQSVGSGTSVMVAQGAESMSDIAQSVYGDRQLWRRVAAANGFTGNATVQAGQRFVMGGNPGGLHNDSSTFGIYTSGLVSGNQTPYGQADLTSLSAQEQSDYNRDVYGKPYHAPFFSTDRGPSVELSGVDDVNGAGGSQGLNAIPPGADVLIVNGVMFVGSSNTISAMVRMFDSGAMTTGLRFSGNAAPDGGRFGNFGLSASLTSNVFVDGDTSGLRYAATAQGSSYPNASLPLEGGGDQVAKSDPNWGDYIQLAAGPGYSGLGRISLSHRLDVLAHGSLDEIRALNAALGIQIPSAPMGAGAEITVNITDSSPTLPIEALQSQHLDHSFVDAAVAATHLPPIRLADASPAPEQLRQTRADAAVTAGTYNTFSEMGHALANGNLGDFWYHFAQYEPKSDAAKATLQAINDRVKGPPQTLEQVQYEQMLSSPLGAFAWGVSTQAGADPRVSNALLAGISATGQFTGGIVGVRQPGRVGGSQGPFASRPRGIGNTTTATLGEPGAVTDLLYGARPGEGLPGSAGVAIPARPTPTELANLTEKHGVEFATTYKYGPGPNGGGGQYYLYSGELGSVEVPISADEMLIYHTHPGGTSFASQGDMDVLDLLKLAGSPQRSSQIVPVGKDVVRFGPNGWGY